MKFEIGEFYEKQSNQMNVHDNLATTLYEDLHPFLHIPRAKLTKHLTKWKMFWS
jgi:hypothetical protein